MRHEPYPKSESLVAYWYMYIFYRYYFHSISRLSSFCRRFQRAWTNSHGATEEVTFLGIYYAGVPSIAHVNKNIMILFLHPFSRSVPFLPTPFPLVIFLGFISLLHIPTFQSKFLLVFPLNI